MNNNIVNNMIVDRLELIASIIKTFTSEIEHSLPKRFLRGPLQKMILKKHNLAVTGPNMRAINEALQFLGYTKIYIKGQAYFRKALDGESR